MSTAGSTQIRRLLERCRKGDAGARDDLFKHTHGRLVIMVRRRLGHLRILWNELDTGDVVASLQLKILERWDTFIRPSEKDAEIDPVVLFFRRSSRLIGDILADQLRARFGRKRNRPQIVSLERLANSKSNSGDFDSGGFEATANADDPEELTMWTEIQECLKELPETLAGVFCMRWFHGLTHLEIAEALHIAEVTSRVRWAEARHVLKNRFPDLQFQLVD